jgi:hypothetical protein
MLGYCPSFIGAVRGMAIAFSSVAQPHLARPLLQRCDVLVRGEGEWSMRVHRHSTQLVQANPKES